MLKQNKPHLKAVIREADCIGCTKCIAACPVDAILGASKLMHTVIASECIGCKLCVAPCPVDCIEMVVDTSLIQPTSKERATLAKKRYQARKKRLEKQAALEIYPLLVDKKTYVEALLERMKNKISK